MLQFIVSIYLLSIILVPCSLVSPLLYVCINPEVLTTEPDGNRVAEVVHRNVSTLSKHPRIGGVFVA